MLCSLLSSVSCFQTGGLIPFRWNVQERWKRKCVPQKTNRTVCLVLGLHRTPMEETKSWKLSQDSLDCPTMWTKIHCYWPILWEELELNVWRVGGKASCFRNIDCKLPFIWWSEFLPLQQTILVHYIEAVIQQRVFWSYCISWDFTIMESKASAAMLSVLG